MRLSKSKDDTVEVSLDSTTPAGADVKGAFVGASVVAVVVGATVGKSVLGSKVDGAGVDSDSGTTAGVGASVSYVILVGATVG